MLNLHHGQLVAAVAVFRLEVQACAHDRDVVRIPTRASAVDVRDLPSTNKNRLVNPQFQAADTVRTQELHECKH